MTHLLPAELGLAIAYDLLYQLIRLGSLWQQWRFGRMNSKTPETSTMLIVTGMHERRRLAEERNGERA